MNPMRGKKTQKSIYIYLFFVFSFFFGFDQGGSPYRNRLINARRRMGGESAEQSAHETGQSAEQAMVDAIGDPSEWGEAAHGYADREAVRRFLDSEDWNLKASRSKLLRALDWRTKERPWELSCSVCATNPRAHSLRCVGLDQQSRPVIYTNFVEAEESEHSSGNVEHLTRISEEAERIMLRHGQSRYGKWVWMVRAYASAPHHCSCSAYRFA